MEMTDNEFREETDRIWRRGYESAEKDLKPKLDAALLQVSEYRKALEENVNLREAIRGEREKNGVLSIWLKEEGDRVKALELQGEGQKKKYSDLLQSHHSLCGKIEELRDFILKNSPECPGDDPCSCVRCRFSLKNSHATNDELPAKQ